MTRDLNELSKQIHEANVEKGWWDGDPCIYTKMQLISTEIAEATEGWRNDNKMDDKLPHRKMEEVELADALIRTLDLGGRLGLVVGGHTYHDGALRGDKVNLSVGELHLLLNANIVTLFWHHHPSCTKHPVEETQEEYEVLVFNLIRVAEVRGFDIFGAMEEKLEYNKTRADHSREARAKAGGKKV